MSVAQAQLSARGIKLFVAEHCPYCHKAEIVAAEKKVPFERVLVPLGDAMPGWYKALNPRETVPTLQVDGKKLVYESNLIAQYLDDVSLPAGSLMGGSAVERHRVEFFMSQAGDFTSACYALMRDPFNPEKRQALNDNAAYVDGILASCQKTGPYFFDDVFSMADIAVLPFLIRFKAILAYYAGYDIFAKAPHMKALYAAGVLRPSVRDTSLTAEEYIAQFAHFLPADSPMLPAKGKHVLYQNVMSPFADRARLACALRKLNVFPVEVQLYPQPEWYKFINPRETVPCIITPNGDAIHESQLIVQYVDRISKDESTAPLIPRGDADQAYAVQFFVESVNNFCSAFFGVILNPSKDTKEELEWACRQIERQLEEHPFGEGPFFGGNAMNAGDVVLLPFLVRAKAYGPDMVGGIDVCKEFKRMGKLATAGMELPEAKAIFAPPEVYAKVIKVVVAKLTGRA